MVCLGNEQRSFFHFWDCIQILHFGLFCWPWWLLHFFWGIPAHSSRYNEWSSELNSPIPVHFSLLIPRMSTFTLAISCLTNFNLPWFIGNECQDVRNLTFQVSMQYCSLQHRNLLLSPVTSTAGYSFCFDPIPSFFLELFLHWSPVAYWAPTDLGSFCFSILSFCLFILFLVIAHHFCPIGMQLYLMFWEGDAWL